jgi:hypothetical protein
LTLLLGECDPVFLEHHIKSSVIVYAGMLS